MIKLWDRYEIEDRYPITAGGLCQCLSIPGGGHVVRVNHVLSVGNVVGLTVRQEASFADSAVYLTPEEACAIANSLLYHAQEARKVSQAMHPVA